MLKPMQFPMDWMNTWLSRARCPVICSSVIAAGTLLSTAPVHALDFHLHSTTIIEDGLKKEQVYIQNDAQTRVLIAPPGGWTRMDGPNSLTMAAPNLTNAMVKIERSNVSTTVAFQGSGLDVFRKRMLSEIPQGATALKLGEETADPLPIFGWKSREFTVEYEFFGQSYRRSVLFVNLNAREQVILTVVALKEDFEQVHATGMDVMRSWQVMPTPAE